ncbi:deoxyribonuclease IV [Thermopolyspora flexuosa]|jgi:deoxyribonuclease-4|uniref:Deoxyribonuclease-4 n=1 Tax=Thermopolyspora flexuosa TaxID=103836 RepID=A0A543IPW3_9ACTN|nr:deoxyribonuclease IV [Thermopolyspora flexuosa]TQM72598.1 deoxyribonuclease-4 [Thermopolyspora flexuosa]GGM69334.1 deoxyribonuclease IV [Thermopolyspora flexuosa]
MVRIGAHVDQDDPLGQAAERGAEVVQFFLGDPQGWKGPVLPATADAIRASDVDVYIHAPYVINVATANNRIRIPSRKLLAAHLEAAAALGAKGLVVHGGHVGKDDDPQVGFDNWRKVFERMECPIPVLIENTAGGGNAMARKLDRIARLWDALDGFDVGFCLDTCHAHAGGEDLADVVDRVKAITGRIDLIHCNDSRDAFGSGADRHANLGKGTIDPELIVAVCRAAGAPIVVETPGPGQAADIAFLRERLG